MKYLIGLLSFISLVSYQPLQAIWPFHQEYKESDDIINAKVGEEFEIELESNPSTGYSWTADYDSAYLELKEQEYEKRRLSPPGTPGKEEWEFKAIKPGKTTITMLYKRPWETGAGKKKVFKVNIRLSGRTREQSE